MSILIKGMEMPKDRPQLLWVYPNGKTLTLQSEVDPWKELQAVPVPPHGRVIDADFLGKILKREVEDELNKNTSPLSWSYVYECLMNDLNIMPTIIEAEEET